MKTTLILIACAILGFILHQSAQADEMSGFDLQLGGASIHQEKRADGQPWNQKNWGYGLQYHTPGTMLGSKVEYYANISTIKNSEFGQTVEVGGGVRKAIVEGSLGTISVGIIAGAMNYPSKYNAERHSNDFFPIILPTLSVCSANRVCLDAMYVPKVQQNQGSSAVLFTARIALKF